MYFVFSSGLNILLYFSSPFLRIWNLGKLISLPITLFEAGKIAFRSLPENEPLVVPKLFLHISSNCISLFVILTGRSRSSLLICCAEHP